MTKNTCYYHCYSQKPQHLCTERERGGKEWKEGGGERVRDREREREGGRAGEGGREGGGRERERI